MMAKIVLDKVEVIRRRFDKKGRTIEEQIEYYSPVEKELKTINIGFNLDSKKDKN